MAKVVNLREARKARQRARHEAEAAANRVKFGRGRAERRRERDDVERGESELESKRLEPAGAPEESER